jgi:hypothetical protein
MGQFHYTARNGKRAELCEDIKRDHLPLAENAGITVAELDVIITEGGAAKEADRQQSVQLAALAADRSGRKVDAADIFAREEDLRDRLPMVVATLMREHPTQARWLSALTFSRYRMRELPVTDEELAADPDIKKVARVERADIPTRLEGVANFCASLLEEGREAIVAQLEARAMPRAKLEELREDAADLAKLGRNLPAAAEATAREAAAVEAQSAVWAVARKALRKVVKRANVPALTAKLAEC